MMAPEINDPDLVYFKRPRKRYPWWVKTVSRPTVEVDPTRTQQPRMRDTAALWARYLHREDYETFIKSFPDAGLKHYLGAERMIARRKERWEKSRAGVFHNIPGHSLADQALMYAAYSLYYDLVSNLDEMTAKTAFVNIVSQTGAPPWKGSKQEASNLIEKAGKALGASQIGFTLLNPLYVREGKEYPAELKYVITILTEWSPEGIKRADTALATMANRVQTFREQNAVWGLRNFIRGLGYREEVLSAPFPAYGVFSGLGELGRMNRLVSPIYGAAVNVYCLVTDLPLAIDPPIDFGLRTFCKYCKKCAKLCPVGAINFSKEPGWEPKGPWNVPGKKVYFENGPLCAEYQLKNDTSCSICLGACPWTKQDLTILHHFSKTLSAKAPWAAKVMVFLDDVFGYGTNKKPDHLKAWWDMDLPPFDINTRRGY